MSDSLTKTRLQNELKDAMRAHAQQRVDAIRYILAAVKQREIDERIVLEDAQVIAIIEKLIKQRKEAIEQFKQANRDDLVAKDQFELDLLSTYLPEPLSEEVVAGIIQKAMQESGATSPRDMGKVMALVKPQVQGKADMGNISKKIKELLGG